MAAEICVLEGADSEAVRGGVDCGTGELLIGWGMGDFGDGSPRRTSLRDDVVLKRRHWNCEVLEAIRKETLIEF